MDAKASLNRLLAVLAERDIGLGYDDLAWLFDSPQSKHAMISWVHDYLGSANLLSPEELDIHSIISQSRRRSNAAFSVEESARPRPLQETDFETAINSIEHSTAEIEKQCAILEAQRDALRKLQIQNRQPVSSTPDNDEKQQSHARTKAQLDMETNELTDSIQQRLGTAQRYAETTIASLRSSSQRQLDKDDRLLDGLQKVMSKLAPLESSGRKVPDFEALTHALLKLESKLVKERTNAVYLNSLTQAQPDGEQQHGRDGEVEQEAHALTDELESLITEVDSVLEMGINKQYKAPIVSALGQSDIQARLQQQQWLDYVKTTLKEMAQRSEGFAVCTQDALSYASAVNRVSEALAKTLPPPTQRPSKLDRRKSSRGYSPKKPAKPLLHRAISQGVKDPGLEMLGYHGIRIPAESGTNVEAVTAALQTALQERQSRLQDLQKSTERSVVGQVAESINVADNQLQNMLGPLYAYSPYGTVQLTDGEAKERLEHLDREIARLGEGIKRLDVDGLAEAEKRRLLNALGE